MGEVRPHRRAVSSGWPAMGTVSASAAGVVAFGHALTSLSWALGGCDLVSTIGSYVEQFARQGGASAGADRPRRMGGEGDRGLLALALFHPRRRRRIQGMGAPGLFVLACVAVPGEAFWHRQPFRHARNLRTRGAARARASRRS